MSEDVLYAMKREMLRRKLSDKTVKTYLQYVKQFLLFCKDKEIREISKKDVRKFLYVLQDKDLAGSSLNVAHNALRFLMIEILHKGMYLKIRFSKVPKRKVNYLTREEVKKVLATLTNKKHKLLVSLMYGAGLRVSEVVNLKKENLDFKQMVGWVISGKGAKDRPFIIPESIKEDLEEFCKKQQQYLFMGTKNRHLSSKSVALIVERAGIKAKIDKHVHPHMFRHSFTTHLLDAGKDVTLVQGLLGHIHPVTTFGYSHCGKPKLLTTNSPLDTINNT
jgi:integrase/recombinase XerD